MIVTYRDSLGYVDVVVSEDGIDFADGFAYFTSGYRDYKIPVEHMVCVLENV